MKTPIKWVGGKTSVLDRVLADFPTTMVNYYEPFLGGGSVLLEVLERRARGDLSISGQVYASDVNASLIAMYTHIQTHVEDVIRHLEIVTTDYRAITGTVVNRSPDSREAVDSPESFYYWIRREYNRCRTSVLGSAYLIFLNKTCFRGLHREGPRGFNVPYGHPPSNASIFDADHLRRLSTLLSGVHFSVRSFADALGLVAPGDFVYLDPPYAPEKSTSFVAYTTEHYDHRRLFDWCHQTGCHFLMSNADVPLVRTAFPDSEFDTHIISVRRAIHSKDPSKRANEVLIQKKKNSLGS